MKAKWMVASFLTLATFSNLSFSGMHADKDLLGWLVVLNKNEIAAANVVLKKHPLDPAVKKFAQYMITDHTQLLHETMRMSQRINMHPVQGKSAQQLKAAGAKELASLQQMDASTIQVPYINAMVEGHTGALAALDGYMKNGEYRMIEPLLKVTAKHVALHLEKAKAVQKKIG